MSFIKFEQNCAEYLNQKYSATGCIFIANGGMDSTAPDIVVKKDNQVICNIEVKEPIAQCGQFVAFPDEQTKTFIYSPKNHPSSPSHESTAILNAMAKHFDKYKSPSSKELGLNPQLYYDRIVDYYINFKKCCFFMTRENIDNGEYIVFPTKLLKDYFDVTACYRVKKSGSHNPSQKEIEYLPELLLKNNFFNYSIIKVGKYVNICLDGDYEECFILEGQHRFQFKRIDNQTYRVTVLGSTNNANVIFSITIKALEKQNHWNIFEKLIM